MEKTTKRIAVIGGGAAGIVASIFAARNGHQVVLFEKADRIGKKILQTGNGRCNITNRNLSSEKYNNSIFVEKIFDKFGERDIENFFQSIGLLLRVDDEGRVYPYSNLASSVLDVLRLQLDSLNVDVRTSCEISTIKKLNDVFYLNDGEEMFDKVILATCQIDDKFVKKFGHRYVKRRPALCPLFVDKNQIKGLVGVRQEAKISVDLSGKNWSEIGEIQFKDGQISGICVFNLSCQLARYRDYKTKIFLDFLPNISQKSLKNMLISRKNMFFNEKIENYLIGFFQKNLSRLLLKNVFNMNEDVKCSDIRISELDTLCQLIKNYPIDVLGSERIGQIFCGGVDVSDIGENMESKLVDELFFAGEIVDIDGECGGYNLSWAWASGKVAGSD